MKDFMLGIRDAVLITIVIQFMIWSTVLLFKDLSTVRPNLNRIMGVK